MDDVMGIEQVEFELRPQLDGKHWSWHCGDGLLSANHVSPEAARAWLAEPNPGRIFLGVDTAGKDVYIVGDRTAPTMEAAIDLWWSLWSLS